jgi:type II secretory pathway pseudopilin PulG
MCGTRRGWPGGRRRGVTLLEVLLALGILVLSLAAIGQLYGNGVRGSLRAKLQTEAILRCETKLAEVVAGVEPFQTATDTPFADDAAWTWSVTLTEAEQYGLYEAEVTVKKQGSGLGGAEFALKRLVREPELLSSETSTSSGAGNSSSSSSTTGGGS